LTRITRDQVTDPVFTRPTWPSTVNEIRINFVNRQKSHRTQTVVVQDTGSIEAVGRIQSKQFDLLGYPTRKIATRQAQRILIEASYPQATLRFKMNRLYSGIEAGSFVQFLWPDWTTGMAVTFWRVAEIRDDQLDSGDLEVLLLEDTYAVGYETANDPEDFQEPAQPFENGSDVIDADVDKGDDHSSEVTGTFGPATVFEPDGVMTGGIRSALVAMQRRSGYIAYAQWTWEPSGGVARNLPAVAPWGFFGTLTGNVAITRHTARNTQITGTLQFAADASQIIDAANYLATSADHYSDLTAARVSLLIINREIIRVGWAVDNTGGSVTFSGLLRGCFGSQIQTHSIGNSFVFIPVLDTGYFWTPTAIPTGEAIDFTADQVTTRGSLVNDTQITFVGPEASPAGSFNGRSAKPPAPELSTPPTDTAGDWAAELRVRTFGLGAGTGATIEEDLGAILGSLPPGFAIYAVGYNSSNAPVAGAIYTLQTDFTTTPGDMPATLGISRFHFIAGTGDPGTCLIEFEATPTGTVAAIRLWTVQNTHLSLDYLEINP
jgi:hypothetical protein